MPSTPRVPRRPQPPRPWRAHLRRAFGRPSGALARPLDRSRSRALLLAVLGLALAALLGGAVAVRDLTDAAHQSGSATAHRHHLEAVLLTPARPPAPTGHADSALFTADAAWTYPPGQAHSGPVTVSGSATAGSTTRLWVDDHGSPTTAPPSTVDLAVDAVALGLFTLGGLAVLLAVALRTRLRLLDRRADRAWQGAWARFEPVWSGRTSRPGPDART